MATSWMCHGHSSYVWQASLPHPQHSAPLCFPPLPAFCSCSAFLKLLLQMILFSRAKQGRKYTLSQNSFTFHSGLWWPPCFVSYTELSAAAYIFFFVPWRTRFICVWIVPIVLPTASDARCGLSRILSAIVIFFSEVCLNFLLSPPDPSDQREMEGGGGGNFVLWTNVALLHCTTPSSGSGCICNNACPRSSPWSTSHY